MAAMCFTARPALGVNAVRAQAVRPRAAAARGFVVKASADRQMWYPGAEPPAYLDGSLAGDFGFDPLRLGTNSATLPYLVEAEKMNARWAMAATAGILFTDAVGLPKWWEAGAQEYGLSFEQLVSFQVVGMGSLEALRIRGFMETGSSGAFTSFPFDPAGIDSPENRLKEVKNGRLAMIAFLGMVSEYLVTGLSPLEALKAHLADPAHANIFTSSVGGEMIAFIFFLACAPTYIIAQKTLGDGEDEEFRPIPW